VKLIKNEKVIDILERTLNCVDTRLIDHGKRVAYLVYNVLKTRHNYNDNQMRDICVLTMLHDVGAYKTEEIDKMVIFETIDVWEHSIYGYLFLKYFSPLKELAPIILFHHANCEEVKHLDNVEYQSLAQLISLCDRADIFSLRGGNKDGFYAHINQNRNIKYCDDAVDMFLASGININTISHNVDSDVEFNNVLRNTPLTADAVEGYIKMIVYSIDFRSSQTVIHTVATACIAGVLAGLAGAGKDELDMVKTGAMLHDIGKIGIPFSILESPGKLNDKDMEVMRTHVEITERILDKNVDDAVMHSAVNHHERLNGSGYPKHLEARDINVLDRIVSVADIFSALCGVRNYKVAYPKEKIISILSDMSANNLLDRGIAELAIRHFDMILEMVNKESNPVIQAHAMMNEEYKNIRKYIAENFDRRNNVFAQ